MTKTFNHVFYALLALVGLLSAIPDEVVTILPPKVKPYVGTAVIVAAWIKGHKNLFVNPDGTPAFVAWISEKPKGQ